MSKGKGMSLYELQVAKRKLEKRSQVEWQGVQSDWQVIRSDFSWVGKTIKIVRKFRKWEKKLGGIGGLLLNMVLNKKKKKKDKLVEGE